MSNEGSAAAAKTKADKQKHITIQIDRVHYKLTINHATGAELRKLPEPDIGADRDLFEVVPGQSDRKIGDGDNVKLRDGQRFFTAPSHINPGSTDSEDGK